MIRAAFTRFAVWLGQDDNAFGVAVVSTSPILALIILGFF